MAELWKWRIRNAPFAWNENVAQLSHETSTANNKDLYCTYICMEHTVEKWAA